MDIHMGAGQRMIPDTAAQARFQNFLKTYHGKKLVILELGVGMELPQLIRFPFEKVAYFNQKSCLYRVHSHLYQMTEEIKERGYSVPMHPVTLLLEEK